MRLAFCILVILILRFALAAPAAMLEVRSNVVGVRKDDMAAWKKRMDSGSDSDSDSDSDYDYDEGEGEGVTEEELESDANNDRKDDSDKDDSDSDGDGDNQSGVGVGYDADDPDNDNEHNDIAYDSSFTSLGAESPRPVVREPTDLEKIVGALSNALSLGSSFRPAAG